MNDNNTFNFYWGSYICMKDIPENQDISQEIIKKIYKNKISTTEIADCLGKTGAINGVYPLNKGNFSVGTIFFAYAHENSNYDLHRQLENVKDGDIVLVETHNCDERAVFGDLVSKFLILYKQATAIVVNGHMRDAHRLIKENYPVWCKGITPLGCFNKEIETSVDEKVLKKWQSQYSGAIAVCDDSGVVIIPKDMINNEFLEKLDFIELQEDIWYYCVDTKKWSTYDTVSLKKYLDTDLLPVELKKKFEDFIKKTE